MTRFSWQLTHNITIHIIRLSSKERCLKINVKNVPTLSGCHLATHPNLGVVEAGESLCWYSFLFVLETSQYPSCLCLDTLIVRLDGKHPSSGSIIPQFDLPQINKIENFVINPGFVFQVFCFSKLFVISSYFFCWGFLSCTRSPFRFKGRHTLCQHISSSTVNSCWNFNLYVTDVFWSSHWGTMIVVQTAWWSNCICPADFHLLL